jgi:hypothetical protein
MEIKINRAWKMRVVGWLRDIILILGMWSIWLVREYMSSPFHEDVVTGFLITIIAIIVLIKEYVVNVDTKIQEFEREYNRIKKE